MNLFYTIRIHLGALAVFATGGLIGALVIKADANAAILSPVLKFIIMGAIWAFMLSWLWLLIQSWVMLLRSWKTRTSGENTKLFLILFMFNFLGAYYFYWKRFEIDPKVL